MSFIHRISLLILLSTGYACQNNTAPVDDSPTAFEKALMESEKMEDEPSDSRCVYKKSDKILETTFPFNKADKIEVVSHDRLEPYPTDSLLIDGIYQVKEIFERVELTSEQTDSLFSLLFDHATADESAQSAPVDCYQPRHTILFYEGKEVIALLEICLQCYDIRTVPSVYYGDFCDEKWCDLHYFFKSVGIIQGLGFSTPMCE